MCSEELHVEKQQFKHDSVKSSMFFWTSFVPNVTANHVCMFLYATHTWVRSCPVYLDMALVLLGILLASPGMVAKWQDLRLTSAWHHYSFTVRCSLTFKGNDLKFKFQFILAEQKKKEAD